MLDIGEGDENEGYIAYICTVGSTNLVRYLYPIYIGRAGSRGGGNRAIARGPTFWGAHKLFEKHFFTIY